MKRACVIGATGQDGSFLCELLLSRGYEVWGSLRRSSSFNTSRIDDIFDQLHLVYADLTDTGSISNLIRDSRPDEIYALGAQSHVRTSFDIPEYTSNTDAIGTLRVLEAAKAWVPNARIYQASSSEMYGTSPAPQNEKTVFRPCSPYGISKLYSYWIAVNYREAYDMHVSNGILFNHESERRPETFVTQKIVKGAVDIYHGMRGVLMLGNLEARRDWGYAPEFVQAMHLMLQQETPDDYVIATGETHSVKEFCYEVFSYLGMDWTDYVEIDAKYHRPTEVDVLQGDYSKAKEKLGWEPRVKFKDLVKLMVDAEIYVR